MIKFEGDHDTLIWKHPIEDFNMGSQLIVHESQEAIFFRDGQALDLFGAGRYTLETDQFPIMEKLYKLPSDSDLTFHSEVYFINKAQHMAFKWGTSEKVTLIDPTSQAPIGVGARGLFNFRVSNARKLLLKLVGTTSGMKRGDLFGSDGDQANGYAQNYFRAIVQLGKDMTGAMAGSMTGGADPGNNIAGNSAVTGDSSDTGAAPGGFEINDQCFSALAALGGKVQDTPQKNAGWKCPECGAKKPEPVREETWKCPNCGTEGITSKFCPECGSKRSEEVGE